MQQVCACCFPATHRQRVGKSCATLRKVRRALGPCRNLDVNFGFDSRKARLGRQRNRQRPGTQVRDATMERRTAEFRALEDALKQTDIVEFISRRHDFGLTASTATKTSRNS